MQLNPYLMFDGRCEEAFRFYEKAFNAKIGEMMTFDNSPAACEGMPADALVTMKDKVVHISMQVGNALLMGSDCPPGMYEAPRGLPVAIGVATNDEADRVFNALSDGAKITMPLAETFWSSRFGMLTDKFGISWMVNTDPKVS